MAPKSKEPTEADIVLNRVNVALARNQRLIASWLPPPTEEELAAEKEQGSGIAPNDELFKPVPELLGLGAPLPSDDQTGVLPTKSNTSLDKLRQQLLGKKRAAEMQKAKAASTSTASPMTRLGPPGSVLKDSRTANGDASSEDEDEGRAAAFARRGTPVAVKGKKKRKRNDASELDDAAMPTSDLAKEDGDHTAEQRLDEAEDEETFIPTAPEPVAVKTKKSRPKSFLDEILADKAGKRKKKGKT